MSYNYTGKIKSEYPLPALYKGIKIECGYRVDLLVENRIIIELKSVKEISPVYEAQLLTYMKLASINHGFLINFNVRLLKHGLKSFIRKKPPSITSLPSR